MLRSLGPVMSGRAMAVALAILLAGLMPAGSATAAPLTQVSGSPGSDALNSVSCVTAKFCVAVGDSAIEVVRGHTLALAEAWNGRDWQIMEAPTAEGSLSGVSCVTASACMAVGGSLAEFWNGQSWRVLRTAVEQLTSVSCVSVSWCMAVGGINHFGFLALTRWRGALGSRPLGASTRDKQVHSG